MAIYAGTFTLKDQTRISVLEKRLLRIRASVVGLNETRKRSTVEYFSQNARINNDDGYQQRDGR